MPLQDLKKIIPSYFVDVWYFMPAVFIFAKKEANKEIDPEATTSLSVYKQYYR